MNWRKWFKRWGEFVVKTGYYECAGDFDVEEMYQMFKARLESERAAHSANAGQS